MKKSVKIISLLTVILLGLATISNASLVKSIEITNSKVEKELELKQGTITKEILKADDKQIDMQIKLENKFDKKTQIVFVLDDSGSMDTLVSGVKRKTKVADATIGLINKLFNDMQNIEIGSVKFSNTGSVLGKLTTNKNEAVTAITEFKKTASNGSTNIITGIDCANKMYAKDEDVQKIMIILTDGVPSESTPQVKTALKNLQSQDIDVFTGIIDITSSKDKVEEIFGTVEKPTVGKLYDIQSESINAIAEEIENVIVKENSGDMLNIKIEDYFPQEIVNNFNIQIQEPTKGKVTNQIDINKKFIWEIDKLLKGQSAILQFKLTLKESQNADILTKIGKTNEELSLAYKDAKNNQHSVKLNKDNQPQIKISINTNDNSNSNNINNNQGTNNNQAQNSNQNGQTNNKNSNYIEGNKVVKLPQTGENLIGTIIPIVIILAIVMGVRYIKYKDIK